jgi:hypothetical protein
MLSIGDQMALNVPREVAVEMAFNMSKREI